MQLPKYLAVQAYLESTGIAFADMKYIEPLLEAMLESKEITAEAGREILGHKSDVARTIYNLFQHIGIMKSRVTRETAEEHYSLTNFGRFLLESKKPNQSIVQPLTPFFLTWLPFKIYLKFLLQNPGADLNEIRTTLGSQVVKHTTDVKNLKISDKITRGAHMPFNEMVIGKVLGNIGEFLGLVTREKVNGPCYLSPLGKYVTVSIDMQNFQFKNLDLSLNPLQLALLDFIDRGLSNIIVFADESNLNDLRQFHKSLEETDYVKQMLRIIYNKNKFNALISTDSAYWSCTKQFSNLTYDQIKVMEFNSKIMDYIEV